TPGPNIRVAPWASLSPPHLPRVGARGRGLWTTSLNTYPILGMEQASVVRRAELRSPLLIPREERVISSHDLTAAPSCGRIHERLALFR
ncbi:hypothetical protein A2U01_0078935, partial [Trifolium medium]|nr:hypothetical protein [Trifolium medium]